MDNKYTPTYHQMWNRDFSLLIAAELLLCISCYMTIPFLPFRLYQIGYVDAKIASLTMVLFVAGICLSGFFGCWLIQNYRRNKVFFVAAICLGATIMCMPVFDNQAYVHAIDIQIVSLMVVCLFGGFVFGHAKRVLSCTLLIDKTESCHRTDANYAAIWIARLTVVVGPIMALLLHKEMHNTMFYTFSACAALIAALLVMIVKFPFRAPEEGVRIITIDRFFLPQGWNVSMVIFIMGAGLGIVMATHMDMEFFASLVAGFIISILILRYNVVRKGKYTSATGNVCAIISLIAMNLHNGILDNTLFPMIFGLGYGLTGSEQLYKLLSRCDHCQRSTAESTYFVSSDGGLFLGIAAVCCSTSIISDTSAIGEQVAIGMFVLSASVCSMNAIIKEKPTKYRA